MATIYKYGEYEFNDADDQFTAEDVKRQLTAYYPELANATTEDSTNADGVKIVTFVKRAGTKGMMDTLTDNDLQRITDEVNRARQAGQEQVALPIDDLQKAVTELDYLRDLITTCPF